MTKKEKLIKEKDKKTLEFINKHFIISKDINKKLRSAVNLFHTLEAEYEAHVIENVRNHIESDDQELWNRMEEARLAMIKIVESCEKKTKAKETENIAPLPKLMQECHDVLDDEYLEIGSSDFPIR